MRDIFFFDSMLTPKIITFVYWLLLLFIVASGIGLMLGNYGRVTLENFFMGVGIIIGGAIGMRILCELLIVLFKIHENIKKLTEK